MIDYLAEVWQLYIASWAFFRDSWIAGMLVAAGCAIPGVLVVARNQIFIGAAIAQAATAGVALGFWVAGLTSGLGGPVDPCHMDGMSALALSFPYLGAIVVAIIAALICAPGILGQRSSPESRTGWVFLTGSALALLLLSQSAHGANAINTLLNSTLLGAQTSDIVLPAIMTGLSIIVAVLARRHLVLLAIDADWAPLAGIRRRRWEFGIALWVALTVAIAIRTGGLLFTFACLILPAMAARGACREVRWQFLAAPLLALFAATAGFALSTRHNLPPPQLTVLCFAALPLLAAPFAWWHRRAGRR